MAEIDEEKILREVATHGENIEKLRREQHRTEQIMMFIVIVLFVGFFGGAVALGGLVVESFRNKEASYQDLIEKIDNSIQCPKTYETATTTGEVLPTSR
jgi:hypothetical protein